MSGPQQAELHLQGLRLTPSPTLQLAISRAALEAMGEVLSGVRWCWPAPPITPPRRPFDHSRDRWEW